MMTQHEITHDDIRAAIEELAKIPQPETWSVFMPISAIERADKANRKAFVEAYLNLCDEHGLYLGFDGMNGPAIEIGRMRDRIFANDSCNVANIDELRASYADYLEDDDTA